MRGADTPRRGGRCGGAEGAWAGILARGIRKHAARPPGPPRRHGGRRLGEGPRLLCRAWREEEASSGPGALLRLLVLLFPGALTAGAQGAGGRDSEPGIPEAPACPSGYAPRLVGLTSCLS